MTEQHSPTHSDETLTDKENGTGISDTIVRTNTDRRLQPPHIRAAAYAAWIANGRKRGRKRKIVSSVAENEVEIQAVDNERSRAGLREMGLRNPREVERERYMSAVHALRTRRGGWGLRKVAKQMGLNEEKLWGVWEVYRAGRKAERRSWDLSMGIGVIVGGRRSRPKRRNREGVNRLLEIRGNDIQEELTEIKDVLKSAAKDAMVRRAMARKVMTGRECDGSKTQEQMYIDSDLEEAVEDGEEERDEYVQAVKELEEAEGFDDYVLQEVALQVQQFAVVLENAPHAPRIEETLHVLLECSFLQNKLRTEATLGHELDQEASEADSQEEDEKVRGPSQKLYGTAIRRTYAMKHLFAIEKEIQSGCKDVMKNWNDTWLDQLLRKGNVKLHPFARRLLLLGFKDGSDLAGHVGRLQLLDPILGESMRKRLWRLATSTEVSALMSEIRGNDKFSVGCEVIWRFGSMENAIDGTMKEYIEAFENEKEAERILDEIHGNVQEWVNVLNGWMGRRHAVARILGNGYGDVEGCISGLMGGERQMGEGIWVLRDDELRMVCERIGAMVIG